MTKIREGFKETEIGIIPEDWEVKELKDMCKINPESLSAKEDKDTIINYIDIESVSTGRISNPKEMKFGDSPSRARRIIRMQDIIVSTVRPYLKAFAPIEIDGDNIICSTGFAVLRTDNSKIDYRFLFQTTISDMFINQLMTKMVGSNYPAVNVSDLSNTYIPTPPLAEQQRIAEILSITDEHIEKLDKTIEDYQLLKKGIMKKLLTEGIGHTEFKETEIGRIPKDWEVTKIENVIGYLKSGLSRKLSDTNIGIPCLRSSNIINGRLKLHDLKYWYKEDPQGAKVEEYMLHEGDILINFINSIAQIGKACIFHNTDIKAIYTTNIFRIKVDENKVDNIFFFYNTQTNSYKYQVSLITKPAVNQASFTTGDFKNIIFPLPPLEEQQRIAQVLSDIDNRIELFESEQQDFIQLKKALMEKLLTGKIRTI